MACTPFFLKMTMRSTCPLGVQIVCNTSCKIEPALVIILVCKILMTAHLLLRVAFNY